MVMHEHRFRKPLRYKGHDYRAPCSVHVIICTWNRQALFGSGDTTGILLNDAGRFVEGALTRLHEPHRGIALDTHMVMPDHLHAIIHLGTHPSVNPDVSISDLIRIFKMRVVKSWPGGVRTRGWPRYVDHLWQLSFYDSLIENDRHLENTREYILANPARWIEKHHHS